MSSDAMQGTKHFVGAQILFIQEGYTGGCTVCTIWKEAPSQFTRVLCFVDIRWC